MIAKLQKTAIFLALSAAMSVAYANGDDTDLDNELENEMSISTSLDNDSSYEEEFEVEVEVEAEFDPELEGLANASTHDVQKNLDNEVDTEVSYEADVEESVTDIEGNAGVNVAAGVFNQQANNVAIASLDDGEDAAVRATTAFEQLNADNEIETDYSAMDADVEESVEDIEGNVGLNVAAGIGNQQKNDLAIAVADEGVLASASSTGFQMNADNEVESDNGWWGGATSASLSDSVNDIEGNVGVNLAAGIGNQQVNTLSIASAGD
ncbi:hypothetical protein [Crenobacter cavernae]|uniref:Adhesin n=1 Tax=Crenobacter cavernae TaxID=2290923 RepID=A0ABY0FFA9_9NEIS|nr:hypothetical protein [Crenobacter cavernae]RXZ44930.1 hypothetical protein EBB06_03295 [Crenobacter cavernae]